MAVPAAVVKRGLRGSLSEDHEDWKLNAREEGQERHLLVQPEER